MISLAFFIFYIVRMKKIRCWPLSLTRPPPECVSQCENRPGRHTCRINLCSSVNATDTYMILYLYKLTNVSFKISIFSDNFLFYFFLQIFVWICLHLVCLKDSRSSPQPYRAVLLDLSGSLCSLAPFDQIKTNIAISVMLCRCWNFKA